MAWNQSDLIEVKRIAGKGRGVFARHFIACDTTIERVPVLVLPEQAMWHPDDTSLLADYVFRWSGGKVALALGYGSLYNHSYQPNARCVDRAPQTKVYTAIQDIEAGHEITINYNGDPDDPGPVGFDVR